MSDDEKLNTPLLAVAAALHTSIVVLESGRIALGIEMMRKLEQVVLDDALPKNNRDETP